MSDNSSPYAPGEPQAHQPAAPFSPVPPPPPSGYGDAPGYAPAPAYPAAPGYASAPGQAPAPGYTPGYGTSPAPLQQYAPAYAPPRPTSGLAITSLVCGIASVVLSWLVIPMLASVAAVITGHIALKQTRQNPAIGGRGVAVAGLIIGYAMLAILVVTIAITLFSIVMFGALTLPFIFTS